MPGRTPWGVPCVLAKVDALPDLRDTLAQHPFGD